MLQEGPRTGQLCDSCQGIGSWHCKDCFGHPQFCTDCCKRFHGRSPLHRVERWTGEYYEDAWLIDTGLVLSLGHNGHECPTPEPNNPLENDEDGIAEDEELLPANDVPEEAKDFENLGYPSWKNQGVPSQPHPLIVVHRNGIHRVPIYWCRCPNHPSDEHQLLDVGLFPSSFSNIKTAFTFHVLDDFLADNLECKTSAMHYFHKIRRFTSGSFPHTAPVSDPIFNTSLTHNN